MYSSSISEVIQASKVFRIVPNWGINPNGSCCCCQPDCEYPGKHPAIKDWPNKATQDEGAIRKWHEAMGGNMHPGFLMGGGFLAIDVDPRNGGQESFEKMEAKYGKFPRTPKVLTGGGGFHLHFHDPFGLKKFDPEGYPGINICAEGSQVVAPPSRHMSGGIYRWELSTMGIEAGVEQVPRASLPECIKGLAATTPTKATPNAMPTGFTFRLPGDFVSCPGTDRADRHERLVEYAGRHLGRGEDPEAVLALAVEWSEKNGGLYPEGELWRQIESLARKEGRKAEQHTPPLPDKLAFWQEGFDKLGAKLVFLPSAEAGERSPVEERSPLPLVPDPSFPPEASFPSFHLPPASSDEGDQGERVVVPPPRLCLHPDAFHGLLGKITKAIAPESEADEAAILVSLLTAFGNAVGPKPHALAGADRHGATLFALLVGPTTARKGQSESVVSWLMERADPSWVLLCIIYGLGSGEGLGERLQDEKIETDKDGNISVSPGASDKRLMAIERECASIFKKARREGNTLSDVLRNAFDGKPIEVVNRRKNSLKATGHHVSIIGHITAEELAEQLKGTEAANGFLNRFLLVSCQRARKLPSGGNVSVLETFVKPLADALASAREAGRGAMRRSPEAEKEWASWYMSHPEHEGIVGKVTARAEAHALRLSLVYALADGSDAIDVAHLRAGLAVWDYCEASALRIFGKVEGTTPLPLALHDLLSQAIGIKPGILRSELWDVAGHKVRADALADALAHLEATGQAHREPVPTGGRTGEAWYPGRGKEGKEGKEAPPPETTDTVERRERSGEATPGEGLLSTDPLLSTVAGIPVTEARTPETGPKPAEMGEEGGVVVDPDYISEADFLATFRAMPGK